MFLYKSLYLNFRYKYIFINETIYFVQNLLSALVISKKKSKILQVNIYRIIVSVKFFFFFFLAIISLFYEKYFHFMKRNLDIVQLN